MADAATGLSPPPTISADPVSPYTANAQEWIRTLLFFSIFCSAIMSLLSAILLIFSLFSPKRRHHWKRWATMLGMGVSWLLGVPFVIFGGIKGQGLIKHW